jgi:hypothetical protein
MVSHSYFVCSLLLLFLSFTWFSCTTEQVEDDLRNGPTVEDCTGFAYPDTLFFISETPDNFVDPIGVEGSGTYSVFPEGLAIDPQTGTIDINASETGLKYQVSFRQGETSCTFFVTIAGINYLDGIYVVDREGATIEPVFNGTPAALPVCEDDDSDEDDSDDGSGDDDDDSDDDDSDDDSDDDDSSDDDDCEFDEVGPGGTRLADQGLVIGNQTGVIDLRQSLDKNFFGPQPLNGTEKDVVLYYRLNDGSMRALNSLGIKFFYFETMEDVPQDLINEIQAKQGQIVSEKPTASSMRFNFNTPRTTRRFSPERRRPRPPYLVVVSRFAR